MGFTMLWVAMVVVWALDWIGLGWMGEGRLRGGEMLRLCLYLCLCLCTGNVGLWEWLQGRDGLRWIAVEEMGIKSCQALLKAHSASTSASASAASPSLLAFIFSYSGSD